MNSVEKTKNIRYQDFFDNIFSKIGIKYTHALFMKNIYFQNIISMYIDDEEEFSLEFFLGMKGYVVEKICDNLDETLSYLKQNKKDFKDGEIIVGYAYIGEKIVIGKQVSDNLSIKNNVNLLLEDINNSL